MLSSEVVKSLLLSDGCGYKVGGSLSKQHAARLCVHRKVCTSSCCAVLGCVGGGGSVEVFEKNMDAEACDLYERGWRSMRKKLLNSTSNSLKRKAAVLGAPGCRYYTSA